MEPINTKEKLLEGLKNVLSAEISARDSYEDDIHTFENKKIVKEISKIRDDEIEHIEIIESLIRLLSK